MSKDTQAVKAESPVLEHPTIKKGMAGYTSMVSPTKREKYITPAGLTIDNHAVTDPSNRAARDAEEAKKHSDHVASFSKK